ncbi:MAG: response regulator [Puniceicoccaceae bacterium]|nr:MAG: response regulator [Puniceicoccaceae bacterium]
MDGMDTRDGERRMKSSGRPRAHTPRAIPGLRLLRPPASSSPEDGGTFFPMATSHGSTPTPGHDHHSPSSKADAGWMLPAEPLLSQLTEPAFILDRAARVLWLNPPAGLLFGRRPGPAANPWPASELGLRCEDSATPLGNPDFTVLSKSGASRDVTFHGLDNRTFRLELLPLILAIPSASPEAPPPGAVFILRNRSGRATRESTVRLLAAALESLGEGVLITDAQFDHPGPKILYVNQGFTGITGYTPEEAVGRTTTFLEGEKTNRQAIEAGHADLGHGRPTSMEVVNYRKDGREAVLVWRSFPVHGPTGKITNFVSILRDVSQVRRLERDLFQSQKMEAIGRLAGGVAHDFNNLLAVILSFSDILLEQTAQNPDHQKYLSEIQKAARRAAELTQQLMAFSRRRNLEPRVLDLNLVVREIRKILRRLITENISLVDRLCPEELFININRTALEQILINLTTNARDALPSGGEIFIETHKLSEEEAAATLPAFLTRGSYARVSFSDTGLGMDEETRSHIFDPFFTTKPIGKGTGLGLSTVYGIVRNAAGHIEVESQPGHGTVFHLYLPLVAAAPASAGEETAGSSATLRAEKRHTILVVEDDQTMCDCITSLLGLYNYEVLSTNRAEEALDQLRETPRRLDLLLTDLMLPKMSGADLAQTLRREQPSMKIIFMTGYSEDTVAGLEEFPGTALLRKPFSLKNVLQLVQQTLNPEA